MTKFEAKNPHFGKSWRRIKILSTHHLLHRKFAAVCRKIATYCPSYFLNPRRRLLCGWGGGLLSLCLYHAQQTRRGGATVAAFLRPETREIAEIIPPKY